MCIYMFIHNIYIYIYIYIYIILIYIYISIHPCCLFLCMLNLSVIFSSQIILRELVAEVPAETARTYPICSSFCLALPSHTTGLASLCHTFVNSFMVSRSATQPSALSLMRMRFTSVFDKAPVKRGLSSSAAPRPAEPIPWDAPPLYSQSLIDYIIGVLESPRKDC